MKLTDYARLVQDFPKPGVGFLDVNSLFASPAWNSVTAVMAQQHRETFRHTTHIVGLESRGFVVGSAIAQRLGIPFVMMRKPGKLPGEVISESYELEYGTDTLQLQTGILNRISRVVVADDLFATGGTMNAAKKLVEQTGATFLGGQVIFDLTFLHDITDYTLISQQKISA